MIPIVLDARRYPTDQTGACDIATRRTTMTPIDQITPGRYLDRWNADETHARIMIAPGQSGTMNVYRRGSWLVVCAEGTMP